LIEDFPGNFAWSNAALVTRGMAPYGAVSNADIDGVCERLRKRQSEPDAWREEWCSLGERTSDLIHSGMYWFTGERFVPPGEQKRSIGEKAIHLLGKGFAQRYPEMERVEVPFEGNALPAFFLKCGKPRAPTIVVFNGMDNCKEMSVLFSGLEFAKRGWNTLAVDGPGQGESLRLRGVYARHDYEVPGRAAYDFVAARPEVDPRRVAVMGYSFGGYYAARIAAFEKRYAMGIAFSALHWDLAAFQREVLRKQKADPKATAQSTFHFRWIMGCLDDPEAAIRKAELFSLKDVAPQIEMPFLVVHGADDKVVPAENAHKLYDALRSPKHLKIFTAEEGGSAHALADNRPLGVRYIADWMSQNL